MTVADVRRARDADEHERLVRACALGAWFAWSEHHDAVHRYLASIG